MDATTLAEKATYERFKSREERAESSEGYAGTSEGRMITSAYLSQLSTFISEKLSEKVHGNAPEVPFLRVVSKLDPDIIALASLSTLLSSIARMHTLAQAQASLGQAIQGELYAQGLIDHDPALAQRIERAARAKRGRVKYRRQAARKMAERAGFLLKHWTRPERILAGSVLLDWLLQGLPEVFKLEQRTDSTYVPCIFEHAVDKASACVEAMVALRPVFPPVSEPPQPWTGFRAGGYWDEKSKLSVPLVRTEHKETRAVIAAAVKDGSMKAHIDGINTLQSVPWVINTQVLDVIKWCAAHGVDVPGIPSKEDAPMPAALADEDYADETKRRLHKQKLAQIKDNNRGLIGARMLFSQDLETAQRLAGDRFYTPFSCDWRGRVYAVPHFNFQRDDRVRALFLFADGVPLGRQGLFWLKVHVANCGDFNKVSKLPFAERVAWVDANIERIQQVAWDPKGAQELAWWTTADQPFLFLAACLELTAALAAGPTYVTRLPVSFDGSCSGLQHLCAMTRAPEGALVNLTASERPQDVYQTVADLVRSRIEADLLDPEKAEIAKVCLDHGVDRKLVKRNVMTYSYSSKVNGMTKQHLEDTMRPLELDVLKGKLPRHPFALPGDTTTNAEGKTWTVAGKTVAAYLAAHVYAAIETVVDRPAKAMKFLQKLARALAHEGKPLAWTTPTGLPWVNRYHVAVEKRVKLWLSDTPVRVKMVTGLTKEIDKDKAANGVAPNFVHALDAAHLLLTVNACAAEGINAIATVHDSFGCLAPHAVRFNQIIREQFVEMYETHDVLAEVLEAAKRDLTVHNWDRLPDCPVPGSLDLNEVLNAPFAFA